MDIEKELEEIFDDPLLDVSDKEAELFDIPAGMKKAMEKRQKADYVAQRRLCDDFETYRPMFAKVQQELRNGQRTLMRLSKTENISEGSFFIISGQMVLLEKMYDAKWTENVRGRNGRTRCIYENGTESDILLQTLRKSVMTDGYVVTETDELVNSKFFKNEDVTEDDQVTGYIYVLSSLSENDEIKKQKDLYKIGFSTGSVEERIANAENEPTYLMAPVKIVATYKVVNMHSQKLEDLIHQVLKPVQFHVTVIDNEGLSHEPKEWFVVPLNIVNTIIEKVIDGSIVGCTYNAELQCLEKRIVNSQARLDITGLKVLKLNEKKSVFDKIVSGREKSLRKEVKQSSLNRYTYVDEADGKRYLKRFDALSLRSGNESALVQISDITYKDGEVEYRLGTVLEHVR